MTQTENGWIFTPVQLNYVIPSNQNGEFSRWFNSLTPAEFNRYWEDPDLRPVIERRVRYPGGLHEWLLIARLDTFKACGVSMIDINLFTPPIADITLINPDGIHYGIHATMTHNQLLNLIDNASSFEEYVQALNAWARDRLPNGPLDLPEGLRR